MSESQLSDTRIPFTAIRDDTWFVRAEANSPRTLYLKKGSSGVIVGEVISDVNGDCAMVASDGDDEPGSAAQFAGQEPCIAVAGINVCLVTQD